MCLIYTLIDYGPTQFFFGTTVLPPEPAKKDQMSDSEEDTSSKPALSLAIDRVSALSSKPDRQLSALRRLLGVNKLLHYVRPDQPARPKGNMHFISICHEVLGDTFNSLFPGKTEDKIYDLTCPEVWTEVVKHLSKISVQNPAKLRMILHTIIRDKCSSMNASPRKCLLS